MTSPPCLVNELALIRFWKHFCKNSSWISIAWLELMGKKSNKQTQKTNKLLRRISFLLIAICSYIKRFEERAGQLYGLGKLADFAIYILVKKLSWQELQRLTPEDQMITAYRIRAYSRLRVDPIMLGRIWGVPMTSKGGGSTYMFDVDKHFYGGHEHCRRASADYADWLLPMPIKKIKIRRRITYFGDGASNQGQVYESFYMARSLETACSYIIENNQYAMGTSVERLGSDRLSAR